MEMFRKSNFSKPQLLLRYVEGVFFAIFDCSEALVMFIDFINKFYANLKFTLERANDILPLLNAEIRNKGYYFQTFYNFCLFF